MQFLETSGDHNVWRGVIKQEDWQWIEMTGEGALPDVQISTGKQLSKGLERWTACRQIGAQVPNKAERYLGISVPLATLGNWAIKWVHHPFTVGRKITREAEWQLAFNTKAKKMKPTPLHAHGCVAQKPEWTAFLVQYNYNDYTYFILHVFYSFCKTEFTSILQAEAVLLTNKS